jgi:hypothetical protein
MKITLLLLSTTLASIALADDPNYPPPSYYQSSNVVGVQSIGFYTDGPGYVIYPLPISCDCTSTTWEWDGKRWSKVIDLFSITNPGQYATGYEIGVNAQGVPTQCSVLVLVNQSAYTAAVYPPGALFDQGVGTKWSAGWAFQGIPINEHDQWEQYCDGAGPEEINAKLDVEPC